MACGNLQDDIAGAALCALIQSGQYIQISFVNPGDSAVTIYAAIEPYGRGTTLNQNSSTDMQLLTFFAPKQTNFPPLAIKPGATITYNATVYDVADYETNNGTLADCSGVTMNTQTYGERFAH